MQRLTPDNACLLVIDLQERLMPTMANAEAIIGNTALLMRAASHFGLPVALSEHYVKGLGPTVANISQSLQPGSCRFEKTRFSAVLPPLEAWLADHARPNIIVCGVEAHVCVLQTALDLRAAGRTPFVMTDAISAGQPQQIAPALRRMELSGCVPSGCLSAMYELAGDASSPVFKGMLALAKAIQPLPT
ncbi:MAG: isochorismatase family protein [Phycisphaerae bacterium]|nr:isochorismatase family protein [Phycisphaerae bacterium]